MNTVNIIGNIAALLTTISFLPQALKTIKTKNTKGLSLPMYILFISGVFLWIIYGVYSWQIPIIVGNVLTFLLAGVILTYKLLDLNKK
ncbi:MAG: glutathione synthetase [Flavobacteriaceae bacterium]|nr:MAG: glutathione synthetase [Flavobacteriaceae bacterium]